jgi:putative transposase
MSRRRTRSARRREPADTGDRRTGGGRPVRAAKARPGVRLLGTRLREVGIAGTIGTVGDALDNALMESTIGLFKTELIHAVRARSWLSRQQVETATAAWVDWFNYRRLHSSVGHQTPVEYETEYHRTHAQEPLAA